MIPYSEFGLEVRKTLIIRRKSMRSLAKDLGISCAYLSEILRGTRKSEAYKEKVAQMLDIPREEVSK